MCFTLNLRELQRVFFIWCISQENVSHEFSTVWCPVVLASAWKQTLFVFSCLYGWRQEADIRIPTCPLLQLSSPHDLFHSSSPPPPPPSLLYSSSTCELSQGDETRWWFIYVRKPIFPSYDFPSLSLMHTHTLALSVCLFRCVSVCDTLCDSDAKWGVLPHVVVKLNVQVPERTTHTVPPLQRHADDASSCFRSADIIRPDFLGNI